MRQARITKAAMVRCFKLTQGELNQLEGWLERFPDLLLAADDELVLDCAVLVVRIIRRGWLPSLHEERALAIRQPYKLE